MGQLNSIAQRLGYSKKWSNSFVEKGLLFKKYIQENLLINRFINLFFKCYSSPVEPRTTNTKNNKKISSEENVHHNSFIKEELTFSHTYIYRSIIFGITCYFMDTVMDEWRSSFLKYINNASIAFFKPKKQSRFKPINFMDLKTVTKFFRKKSKLKREKTTTRFLKKQLRLSRRSPKYQKLRKYRKSKKSITWSLFKPKKSNFRVKQKTKIQKLPTKKKNKKSKLHIKYKLIKAYPINLYDQKHYSTPFSQKNGFGLLKNTLILFPQTIKSGKSQKYRLDLMTKLLKSMFGLKKFIPTFQTLKFMNTLTMKELYSKKIKMIFSKKIYNDRYVIFQVASSAIFASIKSFMKNTKIKISFFGMHIRNISASFITNYIGIKLGKYFTIQTILQPFLRKLKNTNYIMGFRIIIAGRLTRKERAAYLVRKAGDVPLGTKTCNIDYASDYKIMRFGAVGIKTWFQLSQIRPYYYLFIFYYNSSYNTVSSSNPDFGYKLRSGYNIGFTYTPFNFKVINLKNLNLNRYMHTNTEKKHNNAKIKDKKIIKKISTWLKSALNLKVNDKKVLILDFSDLLHIDRLYPQITNRLNILQHTAYSLNDKLKFTLTCVNINEFYLTHRIQGKKGKTEITHDFFAISNLKNFINSLDQLLIKVEKEKNEPDITLTLIFEDL